MESTIENSLLTARGVDESRVAHGKTPDDIMRMLEGGEIDLWATGDLAGRHQMLTSAGDPNAYEIVYTLSENDFYFIFSRDVPDTLVNAFRHALDAVRDRKDAQGVSECERIIYRVLGVGCARQSFSDEDVTALVNVTAGGIGTNASETIRRINAGEAPYRNAKNPALYVFVYEHECDHGRRCGYHTGGRHQLPREDGRDRHPAPRRDRRRSAEERDRVDGRLHEPGIRRTYHKTVLLAG